jgi:hypothetical protein
VVHQVRLSCQFGKGSAGRKAEAASYGQVAIFTDVSKVANEITAGGGPYDRSAHASLSLLPGLDEQGHRVERRERSVGEFPKWESVAKLYTFWISTRFRLKIHSLTV